ncbi:DUF2637 domain-containing protein [Salinispora arenicola]|uniref:Uncharacterized protein DUF2637 n=1 Tax=Salinispora arenicola TaxID=168697 RepID=A0A542XII1_SALAC|nr:DUF2637 domain-containing protein [Salinispora arenicola]TQL35616.1 uncharacterized protein DUF2637 [Salinispora arenicola]GIM87951.1 hypothetical protein Sar04_46870 [Salinispora arenicola]
MTALASAHPRTVADLLPGAVALADQLGEVPSRNRLMREFKIGAPKADALRAELTDRTASPNRDGGTHMPADPFDHTDPTTPDPKPTHPGPAPTPPATPDPAPAPTGEPVNGSPQVAVDGHPGTNITSTPRAGRVTGRGWAYIGVTLGGAVSIAANVAHTYLPKPPDGAPDWWTPDPNWSPSLLAVVLSVFWPVALFVAVEILTRIPWGDGLGSIIARISGVLPVALVAAVVSYRHLSGLLEHYGEDPLTVAIGPLAVDGLMVMASAALLAVSRRKATLS